MSFTYDLSTDIGKVRYFLWDKDETSVLFEDEEIEFIFKIINNNVYPYLNPATLNQIYLTCGKLLEGNATSLAELATKEKIAIFQEDTEVTYKSVMDKVNNFYQLAGMETTPGITADDNFYQLKRQTTNPFPLDTTQYTPLSNLEVW